MRRRRRNQDGPQAVPGSGSTEPGNRHFQVAKERRKKEEEEEGSSKGKTAALPPLHTHTHTHPKTADPDIYAAERYLPALDRCSIDSCGPRRCGMATPPGHSTRT